MDIYIFKGLLEIISLIVGLFLGLFGVYTYYKDRKRVAQRETLEAYSKLQTEVLNKLNLWFTSEIKKACEDKQSDEYKELGGYLADIERFCVGINKGVYDFDTFYKIAHGYFDDDKRGIMPKLIPIIGAKTEYSEEDYFQNIHKVWRDMKNY